MLAGPYFEDHLGTREFDNDGVTVTERTTMDDERLKVPPSYENRDTVDVFEWQLYTPEEIRSAAQAAGFRCLISCTDYDEHQPTTPTDHRMQFVFETIHE